MEAARQLVEGLGGVGNIVALEPCMMRIRATCEDPSLVDEAMIRQINPLGVVRSGPFVQIIVRFNATAMVEQMNSIVEALPVTSGDGAQTSSAGAVAALAHPKRATDS